VIIGVPKGGTTSLAAYLAEHPQVFMARQKEVSFFDEHYALGRDWYIREFRTRRSVVATGEATPIYMSIPEVPGRLANLLPHARLVAILRDPVSRAYSHYWMRRGYDREPRTTFEEAIDAEIADPAETNGQPVGYIETGRYLRQLERFSALYPPEQLLILLSDDLRRDPSATLARVCDFLGVDAVAALPNLDRDYNTPYRLVSHRLEFANRRWRSNLRYPRWMGDLVDAVNHRPRPYPPISQPTRARLVEHYREDNEALAEWLGRDLGAWLT
jgi:sulfotransferase family protein